MSQIIINNKYFETFLTYDQDELSIVVKSAIDEKQKDRITIINTALYLDYDPNKDLILFDAIEKNDIAVVACLVNGKADINIMTDNGSTVLHVCARYDNIYLLKYFLDKGVKVNNVNCTEMSALFTAIVLDNVKSVELLLKYNASVGIRNDMGDSVFSVIIKLLIEKNNKSKSREKQMNILRMVVNAMKKIPLNEFVSLALVIYYCDIDVLKIIGDKFPQIANMKNIKPKTKSHATLFLFATSINAPNIVEYFLNMPSTDLLVSDNGGHCIHGLSWHLNIESVTKVLNKHPEFATIINTNDNNRSAIEYTLLPCDQFCSKDEKKIIELIKILVAHGADINSRNSMNFRSLEIAMRNYTILVVNEIINQGANLYEKERNEYFYPPITNNDPVGLAVQLARLDVIDLLLKKKAILHLRDGIPTALMIAIIVSDNNTLKFLLEQQEIKIFINKKTNKYLYDFAISEGCVDKNILKNFVNTIDTINFDDKYIANGLNKYLSRYYINYNEIQELILEQLSVLTTFVKALFTYRDKRDIFNIISFFDDFFEHLYDSNPESINKLIEMLMIKINYKYIDDIKKCIMIVGNIIQKFNIDKADEEIKKMQIISKYELQKLEQFYTAIDIAYKNCFVSKDNLIVKTKTETDTEKIERMLFKLRWPITLNHYDFMLNSLSNIEDTCEEYPDKIIVTSNNNMSIVYATSGKTVPSIWFKSYAPNIGHEDKRDINHMFSFLLDSKLKDFPCTEVIVQDPVHPTRNDHLLYFKGELCFNGRVIRGVYEYFINGYQTLFHRLFKNN